MEINFHTSTKTFRKTVPKSYRKFLGEGCICGFTDERYGNVHINLPVINFLNQHRTEGAVINEICEVVNHESLHSVIHNSYGFHPEWVVRSMTGEDFTPSEKRKYKTIKQ